MQEVIQDTPHLHAIQEDSTTACLTSGLLSAVISAERINVTRSWLLSGRRPDALTHLGKGQSMNFRFADLSPPPHPAGGGALRCILVL